MAAPLESLATAFVDALPEASRAAYRADGGLAERLGALVETARAATPVVDELAFVTAVAVRVDADAAPEQALGTIRAGDLALALACARGDAGALAQLEGELVPQVELALSRFRGTTITRDELLQAIRERLLVAQPGAAARIASYQGRGDLRSWLRMVATRYLIDLTRSDAARPDRVAADDRLADIAGRTDDPELAFLKRQYRAEFRAAFGAALGRLEPRDRNILRHRYLDGLEVGELAAIYGIHRVSMSRTLGRIRDQLLADIRSDFLRRAGLGRDELDEVMAMIASQLELSLSGLLR